MNYQILNKYTWFRLHGFTYIFFRATLCVSAVFAISRCLSVCLSVRHVRVYRPIVSRRLKISSNFYIGQVAPSFWFSFYPSAYTKFQAEPLKRRRKIHGGRKKCDFRL